MDLLVVGADGIRPVGVDQLSEERYVKVCAQDALRFEVGTDDRCGHDPKEPAAAELNGPERLDAEAVGIGRPGRSCRERRASGGGCNDDSAQVEHLDPFEVGVRRNCGEELSVEVGRRDLPDLTLAP